VVAVELVVGHQEVEKWLVTLLREVEKLELVKVVSLYELVALFETARKEAHVFGLLIVKHLDNASKDFLVELSDVILRLS